MKLSHTFKMALQLLVLTTLSLSLALVMADQSLMQESSSQTILSPSASILTDHTNLYIRANLNQPLVKANTKVAAKANPDEIPCNFKKTLFQQLSYLFENNTACVYR